MIYKLTQGFLSKQMTYGVIVFVFGFFTSCGSGIPTPESTKYLAEFHEKNFASTTESLDDGLALYVDYSTCNKLGQNSTFFQTIGTSLADLTTSYFSIKGSQICQEDISEQSVYLKLRNINEVNYAELQKAADMIANGTQESVLLTDGEYFTQNMAKGNESNPWLKKALKTWIVKGYDIHIFSEPYIERNNGRDYNKKRFYIIFTDDMKKNNIYDRICRTISLEDFSDVDEFHISASHPKMKGNGNNSSVTNETLQSRTEGYGDFEIQDWYGCDWETIENYVVNAIDETTGELLPNGQKIISLGIDRNSFGCYKIKDLDLKVYDINQEYADYFFARESQSPATKLSTPLIEISNFMLIDKKSYSKHGDIDIYFNQQWFDPNNLTGDPYNYFKIDLSISQVQPIFENHKDKFIFESICNSGHSNVSIASSIEQCLADQDVIDMMIGQTVYTIYVKSESK